MGSSNYVSFPRVEGRASRQAHADLPDGTFERELGKEGFFGPATHMYHSHAPTGWLRWKVLATLPASPKTVRRTG